MGVKPRPFKYLFSTINFTSTYTSKLFCFRTQYLQNKTIEKCTSTELMLKWLQSNSNPPNVGLICCVG